MPVTGGAGKYLRGAFKPVTGGAGKYLRGAFMLLWKY